MNEVEIVNHLQSIQRGKFGKAARNKLHLKLKKTLIEHIRRGYQVPLCLGWYTALMVEHPKAGGNEFLDVKDKTDLPGNRAEATFAMAWSYGHLLSLDEEERRDKYGYRDIYHCLDVYDVPKRTIKSAIKRYGPLVDALNAKEFVPESVNPTFARYAIEQVYIYDGVADDDVYFEAILEDGTLIQYLRDGHFHALSPIKDKNGKRVAKYASYDDSSPPEKRHTRITYQHKEN